MALATTASHAVYRLQQVAAAWPGAGCGQDFWQVQTCPDSVLDSLRHRCALLKIGMVSVRVSITDAPLAAAYHSKTSRTERAWQGGRRCGTARRMQFVSHLSETPGPTLRWLYTGKNDTGHDSCLYT